MSQELKPTKQQTLTTLLTTYKSEIARALPRHCTPDRMLRIALTSARKNPELFECTPESFMGAVIQSAQLGLEPDTPLGHAYLIPYRNSKTNQKEVNFMPGYRGFMDLVYRTTAHPILLPAAAYEGDTFEYELGLTPKLVHIPKPRDHEPRLTYAYCTASFADGRKEFMVMSRLEIEKCRNRSKATKFSPWQTDYEAMALKTVIRRFVKYLPMSAELQTAVGLDDLAEAGTPQHNDQWLRTSQPILTKTERIDHKMAEPGSFEEFKE